MRWTHQRDRVGKRHCGAEGANMKYSTQEIAGTQAIKLLEVRRNSYFRSGEYPFLIGDPDDLARLEVIAEFECRSPREIIERSQSFNLGKWLYERRAEEEEFDFDATEVLGNWPGHRVPSGSISLHRDSLTGEAKPSVLIGLATIDEPWHLPAIMRLGNWNDCPDAVVHCALWRNWQQNYGAEIVGVSSDTIECIVSRPPQDREAAIELAWQQFWYCEDIVHQGCQTISNLAATLVDSKYWNFWWD